MSVSRRAALEGLAARARELPPAERSAFLDEACGDDETLRAAIESRLAQREEDTLGPPDPTRFDRAGSEPFVPPTPLEDLTSVGHYRVLEKLGGGGMGVVYRAEDVRLRRLVALKFLPPHLGSDEEALARFRQEAQAASALDHPNVCTIHEIGETAEGRLYIAMAHYRGETLRDRIRRGPLPPEEVVELGLQAARGLQKAHDSGIVHRDVKPANLMITADGLLKILDFGLAKMEDVVLTQSGAKMGTVSYMSPEQAEGGEVDARTDIWSLGVVMYEMLTGSRPFTGDNPSVILHGITQRHPRPISELVTGVPQGLRLLVDSCLAKDPRRRLPDMAAVVAELEALRRGDESSPSRAEPPPARRSLSLVVLPFADISPERDNDYFSDGLTEELISELSRLQALRVISRTSAMRLKGSEMGVRQIGRELDVDYVLEGSVRKAGKDLRITAQLVEARNDVQVWSDRYRGTLDDIFDIQERVARSIADALEVQLSPSEYERIGERPIANVHAYDCYLRARQEIWRWTEDALDRAVAHLQAGLDIVGENGLLYAGLGYVHWQYVNAIFKSEEHLAKAEEYAEKVFSLEPESLHGYRLLGLISASRGDMQEALDHLKRALASDPNDPDTLSWYTMFCAYVGRTDVARELVDRLVRLDPLNAISVAMPGWFAYVEGDFAGAVAPFERALEVDPENVALRFLLIRVLASGGRIADAVALADELLAAAPGNPFTDMSSCLRHALEQQPDAAREAITPVLRSVAPRETVLAWALAGCYALIGDKEEALDWLQVAVKRGFWNHPFLARIDPLLGNLRDEGRFIELMGSVEKLWQELRV